MTPEEKEWLIAHYPNAYHVFDELEEACIAIKAHGNGWGRMGIDSQGIDKEGKLLVKFIDLQMRLFRDKQPGTPNHKKIS